MAGFIIIRGIDRLQNPMEVPSLPMFVMAVGGIGLEIASLFIMYKGQKESLNIRGSFWHVMNAFLGSIAVIIEQHLFHFGRFTLRMHGLVFFLHLSLSGLHMEL